MANEVYIEGLREFRGALRRIDGELPRGITRALKEGAEIVAGEVRATAPIRSRRLVGSVRSFTRGDRAGVRVTARRASERYPSGYPYPRRLEFESGGVRAFVAPALARKRSEVVERMERLMDDVGDIWEG